MRVNSQRDGRPFGRSKLRSYFRRLWTKVHQFEYACADGSDCTRSLQAVFRLTIYCFIPEILAISRNCRNFDISRPVIFFFGGGGAGPQNF